MIHFGIRTVRTELVSALLPACVCVAKCARNGGALIREAGHRVHTLIARVPAY